MHFVFRVNAGCCLVQQNNGGVFQHGAGNGDPLFFTARQGGAAFPDDCVIPVRKRGDKLVAAGLFRRFHHLFVGSVWKAKFDIVFNGVVEQIDVLEYHAHIVQQAVAGKIFYIVFQNVYLFEDTIENNIKFGRPDATREDVIEAAKKACCHEFISALPEGYHTLVGEGGASLSGGERQRISIARAILKDAPIIILDEATASVDPENERELQAAIAELTKDKTIIMIAHRLSTVRNADQILVLDKGRIVQCGTHRELMEEQGLYRRFIQMRETAIGWNLGRKEKLQAND